MLHALPGSPQSLRSLYSVSVRSLAVLAGRRPGGDSQTRRLRTTFAGSLPTVRRLPAVALALYFTQKETFGILPLQSLLERHSQRISSPGHGLTAGQ